VAHKRCINVEPYSTVWQPPLLVDSRAPILTSSPVAQGVPRAAFDDLLVKIYKRKL